MAPVAATLPAPAPHIPVAITVPRALIDALCAPATQASTSAPPARTSPLTIFVSDDAPPTGGHSGSPVVIVLLVCLVPILWLAWRRWCRPPQPQRVSPRTSRRRSAPAVSGPSMRERGPRAPGQATRSGTQDSEWNQRLPAYELVAAPVPSHLRAPNMAHLGIAGPPVYEPPRPPTYSNLSLSIGATAPPRVYLAASSLSRAQ